MDQRVATVSLMLFAALAGCASHDQEVLYEHAWSYGPDSLRLDGRGHPYLVDHFDASKGGPWTLSVSSNVANGTFEVHLRGPNGTVAALASGDGVSQFLGTPGEWSVEIVTDASSPEVPAGRVDLRIVG